MARQNKDDMTVVTFVSTNIINLPPDLQTALDDLNHAKGQWRNHTRNNCEKNGSFRATAVCLGLLCAFLPLAVTVLCVKFTKEYDLCHFGNKTNYWLSLSKKLTEEREELRRDLAKLQARIMDYEHADKGSDNSKWISYNLHSYFLSSEWKNWTESREECRKKGADLVIINNIEEQEFIRKLTSLNTVWIGLSDIDAEGVWKWVNGSTMTWGLWYPGEPNSYILEEDCAVSRYTWADYPCNYTFAWICERDLKV